MSSNNNDSADLPLPPGWSRGFSQSQQRPFYFNKETKHTQWHFPTASEAADPQMAKRRAEQNKTGKKRALEKKPWNAKKPKLETTHSHGLQDSLKLADSTSVAIIVPFRDLHKEQHRAQHLKQFIPHMNSFLHKLQQEGKLSNYHLYIIEQSNDGRKFNRGKLLNIGFCVARDHGRQVGDEHDVFVFHDVDLLPRAPLENWYCKFPTRPIHIARVWDRYSNNPKYFGGIVSFSASDYKRINGYPNTFWGWGGEDDEMQKRCEALRIQWDAPNNVSETQNVIQDLEEMDLQEKLGFLRQHKEWKCMVKWEALEEHGKTWNTNGLSDLQYKVLKKENPLEHVSKATKITVDVMLNGNHWSNEKSQVDYKG